MVVRDALLSLLTLSIYRSWARTNWRKKIIPSIKILDEPLAYDGTGLGLFVREFPFIAAFILVVYVCLYRSELNPFFSFSIYLIVASIIFGSLAYVRIRYFMTHVTWSGVRYRCVGGFREAISVGTGRGPIAIMRGIFLSMLNPTRTIARVTDQLEFAGQKFKYDPTHRPPIGSQVAYLAGVLLIIEWLNVHAVEAYLKFITQQAPLFDMSAFETARFAFGWALYFTGSGILGVNGYRSRMGDTTLGPLRYTVNVSTLPFIAKWAIGGFAILAVTATIFCTLPLLANLSEAGTLQRVYMFCIAIALSVTARTIIRDAWIDPWIRKYLYARTRIENAEFLSGLVNRERSVVTITS
jgi:uncharacterized membrane protein YjgN (DUF898 family)